MLKKSIFSVLIAITIMFQGCNDNKTEEANSMISENEYVLTNLKNEKLVVKKEVDGYVLEGAKGKVIIFDLFATWCPPCQGEASHLSSLQDKYKDDLVIIGVTIEDNITNDKLLKFRTEYSANYALVNSDQNRRLINSLVSTLELGERFPIPMMAMYKDGKLINHYIGAVQEEFIESDIKKALGK
jgi:thiol-disulfide isomerase/thioredoxin